MQVRGKTVYLQYSNRQEIVNAKNTADTPSNVLLVSLENLMVPLPPLLVPPHSHLSSPAVTRTNGLQPRWLEWNRNSQIICRCGIHAQRCVSTLQEALYFNSQASVDNIWVLENLWLSMVDKKCESGRPEYHFCTGILAVRGASWPLEYIVFWLSSYIAYLHEI
jgi:hypothetical protein